MKHSEVESTLLNLFKNNWTGTSIIKWPNTKIKQPPNDQSYVAIKIEWGGSNNITVGTRGNIHIRYLGELQIDVMVPENTGTIFINSLYEQAASLFRNLTVNGVRLFEDRRLFLGFDGFHTHTVVAIPFRFDDLDVPP